MKFPPGTDARMGLIGSSYVFIAPALLTASSHLLALIRRPGSLNVIPTHDAGVHWTARAGVILAESVLQHGGPVIMQCATMKDAIVAHSRVKREMADSFPVRLALHGP